MFITSQNKYGTINIDSALIFSVINSYFQGYDKYIYKNCKVEIDNKNTLYIYVYFEDKNKKHEILNDLNLLEKQIQKLLLTNFNISYSIIIFKMCDDHGK